MNCPVCKASMNDYGIWKGEDIMYCTNCKTNFNFRTEEILFQGTSLEQGCRKLEKVKEIRDGSKNL